MAQQKWCISEFTSLLEGFHDPAVLISPDYEILATNRHYEKQHGQAEEHPPRRAAGCQFPGHDRAPARYRESLVSLSR